MAFVINERKRINVFEVDQPVLRNPDLVHLVNLPSAQTLRQHLGLLRASYRRTVQEARYLDPLVTPFVRVSEYAENIAPFLLDQFYAVKNTGVPAESLSGGTRPWATFARKMMDLGDAEVKWDGGPLIRADLIEISDTDVLTHQPKPDRRDFADHTLIRYQWPILKRSDTTDYYEFSDPNIFFYLLEMYYMYPDPRKILDRLDADNFLTNYSLDKVLPVLSFMAEDLLLFYPAEFENFIHGLAGRVGGETGFAASACILEDLSINYQPFRNAGLNSIYKNQEPWAQIDRTIGQLKENYQKWQYANRIEVISPDVCQQAMAQMTKQADPKTGLYAYLEVIFTGMGARTDFEDILPANEIELIRWIFDRAVDEKKMEAALIPVAADIVGYADQATLVWLTQQMQLLWTALLAHDDTVDQSPWRGEMEALYVQEGMAAGIQQPFLTMIKVIRSSLEREDIDNTVLGSSMAAMLDRIYSADMRYRQVDWEDNPEEITANYKEYMQILAWFPRYTVKVNQMAEASGLAIAEFMENFGVLLLINNDFDDLIDRTHPAGEDIGSRVNMVMNWFYHCQEIPEADRLELKFICEDEQLVRKKRAFEKLDINNQGKITRALELLRKYRAAVARSMAGTINKYRDEAENDLREADNQVPVKDERNEHYFAVLRFGLDGLFSKLQSYMIEGVRDEEQPTEIGEREANT